MQTTTRTSTQFPGLTLELQTSDRGSFITFKGYGAWTTYQLEGGMVAMVDCSDRGGWKREIHAHVITTARAYSAALAKAGKATGAAWAA